MVKWEYHVVLSSFQTVDAVRAVLNQLGDEGWELVAVTAMGLFFKRAVSKA
jgi:hypothetical protein